MSISRIMHGGGFTELRAAIAVAEHRSFRAAANALGVSPTALSSNVRALEDRLRIRLFNRTTRSVSLTSAGEEFIHTVAPLVAEIERAMEAAGSHGLLPSGVLRINSSVSAGHEILRPLLRAYMARHPSVEIELTTETRLVDVVLDGCDAGIRLAESVPADMVAVPMAFGLDFCVVGSPEYFADHPQPKVPVDLLGHRCIRSKVPGGGVYKWEFERHGEIFDVDVPGSLTLDEQSLMLKAAVDSMGLSYVSRAVAGEALERGELLTVLDDWIPSSARLCLYYPRNRNTSAALRAMIELIRAHDQLSDVM